MSLNRANMLVDTNSPKLARADINDMFADLGYGTTGSASPITITGEANKIFKFSSIANTVLHELRIRKSSANALNIQDDSLTDIFNIDTTSQLITGSSVSSVGGANKLLKINNSGNVNISNGKTYRVNDKIIGNYINVKDFGAIGDGVTDDTIAINSAMAESDKGTLFFPKGIYKCGSISLTKNIIGEGKDSIIFSNGNNKIITIATDELKVQNIIIRGSNNSTYANEIGLYIDDKYNIIVSNCVVENFLGNSGILNTNLMDKHIGNLFQNCIIRNNKKGINFDTRGEYSICLGSTLYENEDAIVIKAGNISIVANNVSDNVNGIRIISGDNDSHGLLLSNLINHNSGYGIYIDGISNGFNIANNEFYNSNIYIKSNLIESVLLNANYIGSSVNLYAENAILDLKNNTFISTMGNVDLNYNSITSSINLVGNVCKKTTYSWLNGVEYLSNSSQTDGDDSSSFVYSEEGSQGIFGATNLTAIRKKTVRCKVPIKNTDIITLQVKDVVNNSWVDIGSSRYGNFSQVVQGSNSYGMSIAMVNSTDININFFKTASPTSATYASDGLEWSSLNSNIRWRLLKISGIKVV